MSVAESLLAFTLAATLLTITPGIDTALVLRTAAVEGRKQALQAAVGINAGCLVWGAAVAFGLGALLAVSELAYSILKYCGALYLAWLGLNLLLRPRRSWTQGAPSTVTNSGFVRGFLGNLLNPKVGIFYLSFLPQFIAPDQALVPWTFMLVGIHIILSMLWALLLIGATQPLAHLLRREAVIIWLERSTGLLFVLFALKLALSRR